MTNSSNHDNTVNQKQSVPVDSADSTLVPENIDPQQLREALARLIEVAEQHPFLPGEPERKPDVITRRVLQGEAALSPIITNPKHRKTIMTWFIAHSARQAEELFPDNPSLDKPMMYMSAPTLYVQDALQNLHRNGTLTKQQTEQVANWFVNGGDRVLPAAALNASSEQILAIRQVFATFNEINNARRRAQAANG